jgi:hypothetical protein
MVARNVATKAALCSARKKLKSEPFVELNTKTVEYFTEHAHPLTWNGFFLKAVDGSTVKLPNYPRSLSISAYGTPGWGNPSPWPGFLNSSAACPAGFERWRTGSSLRTAYPFVDGVLQTTRLVLFWVCKEKMTISQGVTGCDYRRLYILSLNSDKQKGFQA